MEEPVSIHTCNAHRKAAVYDRILAQEGRVVKKRLTADRARPMGEVSNMATTIPGKSPHIMTGSIIKTGG